ncbi:hypothetical protein ACJ41O_013131 [Fusarium nematophilum]
MPRSMSRESSEDSAVQKWIDPVTGKPNILRFNPENLEERTVAAMELYEAGFYRSVQKASDDWKVPYHRLRGRILGAKPRSQNGGNRMLLKTEEEESILCWAHRRVTQGHHIQLRALQHHANVILKATGREDKSASYDWAKRFMRRHRELFKRQKSSTRDVKRKAMQDRAHIEAWFKGWEKTVQELNVKDENTWNFDETGFMVGYLQKGTFLFTYNDVADIILTDAHDTVLVTVVEAVSLSGKVIDPFIVIPGVVLQVRYLTNNLPKDTTLATSPTGYINDIIAHEWIQHFEKLTRPANPTEKRLIVMDGCENHFAMEIFHFAQEHNIELFPFPPHLTHLLQPCDVGLFGLYKQWHQQILYREIADGNCTFGKADFLTHLQEARERTFKKSTILSAWEKSGISPFNPSVVLEQLKDPLSSLAEKVSPRELPGYVREGTESSDCTLPSIRLPGPQTPPSKRKFSWNDVCTPPLRVRTIGNYSEYVRLRIEASMASGVPLTPSVTHTYDKMRKAHVTLALNGIAATQEMHRLKEKALRREKLNEATSFTCKYGPIRVSDARLRVARDEYHRQAAQAEEQRRLLKRDAHDEVKYIRRWLAEVRSRVRRSVTDVKISEIYAHKKRHWKGLFRYKKQTEWWSKTDRRLHLDSAEWLSQRYVMHRELHEQNKLLPDLEPAVPWPPFYDTEVIREAMRFIALEERERRARRGPLLDYEVDGLEITLEVDGESEAEEFIVVKGEDEEEDL